MNSTNKTMSLVLNQFVLNSLLADKEVKEIVFKHIDKDFCSDYFAKVTFASDEQVVLLFDFKNNAWIDANEIFFPKGKTHECPFHPGTICRHTCDECWFNKTL